MVPATPDAPQTTNQSSRLQMECKYCKRTFSKGEHLRRHERSHTGARPYVCKTCKRPFSRQDSLMRHERLHKDKPSTTAASSTADLEQSLATPPESLQNPEISNNDTPSFLVDSPFPTGQKVQQPSQLLGNEEHPITSHTTDLDFDLMWPDSQDLFETIMSSDSLGQWQLPAASNHFSPASNTNSAIGSTSSFGDRAPSIGVIPSGGNAQAIDGVSSLIASLSSSVTAEIEATTITSVFLDECLHMFFVRFIPIFPIMHRATFVFRDCTHALLLNAIAIGSLYLGPRDAIAKGEVIWRLAHTAIATSWQQLITHRGRYDSCSGVQLVSTVLLGHLYGALSRNKSIRTTSQAFHTLGLFWARHCGMFESQRYPLTDLPHPTASQADKDHQWRLWVAGEVRLRTLAGLYTLDGLIAQMSGEATSVRHTSNKLGLPGNEACFEAGSADEWLRHMQAQQPSPFSFRSIFRLLFSPIEDVTLSTHNFTSFSIRILLEGIQSFVSDREDTEDGDVGVPSRFDLNQALYRAYDSISQSSFLSTEERLEVTLRWHVLCIDLIVPSAYLSRRICRRFNTEQDLWSTQKESRSDFDLISWAGCGDARRALLHALAIQDMIEQLPRGRAHAIHMPTALFSASAIYTVFTLAGSAHVKVPSSIHWKDTLVPSASSSSTTTSTHPDATDPNADLMFAVYESSTLQYIRTASCPDASGPVTTRNLLYELNSVQKLFRCLVTQWGIAGEMEKVVDQWVQICH